LKKLMNDKLVKGIDDKISGSVGVCEPCIEGKIHKTPFPKSNYKRNDTLLGLIHTDVCGKMSTPSLSGSEYFVTFIDDHSRYSWVYFIKHKSEVFSKFCEWKSMIENATGQRVKTIRSDNGGEYTSNQFQKFLKEHGIVHQLTVPKTPEQNGVAERLNRTLVESARCMLSESKLPKRFWAEAINTASYLRNRSPSAAVQEMTPYEAVFGEKPDVSMLKVFGCLAYMHVPKDERQKFDVKADKCVFLGYEDTCKGYRVFNIERKTVCLSRDIICNESICGLKEESMGHMLDCSSNNGQLDSYLEITNDVNDCQTVGVNDCQTVDVDDQQIVERDRPERHRQAPDRYGEWVYLTNHMTEPNTYSEALDSESKMEWDRAMKREITSLKDNNVWDLVKLPRGGKVVGCKWVFKEKLGPNGQVARFKARLVAQGFSQRKGEDYEETFSPVVRMESVRSLLAFGAKNNMIIHQMDVETAFLNGNLTENVYMSQPEGFVVEGKEDHVCKLNKSIYGLKQSSRCWNVALHDHLCKIGLVQSLNDPCIYYSEDKTKICAVYVDDIILLADNELSMSNIKKEVSSKFIVKDLGELDYFLGIHVRNDVDSIILSQSSYIERMLERFSMDQCKPVPTPVDPNVKLVKADEESELVDVTLYQSAVGSLLYLSTRTRPDIAYAVGSVAKYCSKPTKEHWVAVKRIMRYLRGTISFGLHYPKAGAASLVGFSDSDWGGDQDDRRSTSGYVFMLGDCCISWKSKKQACVALSTAEAEYIALSGAGQECVWLKRLMGDLDVCTDNCILYEDNQSAIALTKNPQFHGRSKHIAIRYHYIRELVENRVLKVEYCSTSDMIADVFTKGLCRETFVKLRELLGVKPL
jgi:hypothetical protein